VALSLKQLKTRLRMFLQVFSQVPSPKSLFRHELLFTLYHALTTNSEASLASLALDLGFYLGFTGIVSFKNGENVREVLAKTPRDRIVVETDSPFLAPLPYRGQRNEPARVREVASWVEKALGEEPGAMTEQLWKNAHALYRIPLPA
jgi:TatD DNase family protein